MNYQAVYDRIISKAKLQSRVKLPKDDPNYVYYESHHIVPKCIGGDGRCNQWKWHPNIILLTPKEHFICHLLLSEIYPNNTSIVSSVWLMCNTTYTKSGQYRYKPSSKTYERLKLKKSNNTVKSETKRKQSLAQKGNKNGAGNKGNKYGPCKEETRLKIGLANKGRTASNGGRKIKVASFLECPHCNKIGNNNGGQMKRWHFNNCKLLDR
jgi:hypothetical protein